VLDLMVEPLFFASLAFLFFALLWSSLMVYLRSLAHSLHFGLDLSRKPCIEKSFHRIRTLAFDFTVIGTTKQFFLLSSILVTQVEVFLRMLILRLPENWTDFLHRSLFFFSAAWGTIS
jgi:hypothetical protein